MKIHEPEKLEMYACEWCADGAGRQTHYPSDELFWTVSGWLCEVCRGANTEWDEDGNEFLKASETPEWDGKTLKEYLKEERKKAAEYFALLKDRGWRS